MKKKWNLKFLLFLLILFLLCVNGAGPELPFHLHKQKINEISQIKKIKKHSVSSQEQFEKFLLDLAFSESSLNWKIWNSSGHLGLWQIGKSARNIIGYEHVSFSEFKKNPKIFPLEDQIDAITKLLHVNYETLKPIIEGAPYKVDGVTITKSGILAGAHLAGAGGVKRFFKTNGHRDPKDVNGTSLSFYMKKFTSYNFDLNLIYHPNYTQGILYYNLKQTQTYE